MLLNDLYLKDFSRYIGKLLFYDILPRYTPIKDFGG